MIPTLTVSAWAAAPRPTASAAIPSDVSSLISSSQQALRLALCSVSCRDGDWPPYAGSLHLIGGARPNIAAPLGLPEGTKSGKACISATAAQERQPPTTSYTHRRRGGGNQKSEALRTNQCRKLNR